MGIKLFVHPTSWVLSGMICMRVFCPLYSYHVFTLLLQFGMFFSPALVVRLLQSFQDPFKCPLLGQTFWILNAEGRPLQDILFLFLSTNHTVSPLPVYMFTSPIELWAPWAEGQCLIHFVSPSSNLMTGHSGCSGKVFDWCVEDTVLQGRILNHFVFRARKWLSNKASPGHGQIRAALGVNLFRSLVQIERGKPPVTQHICAAHGETQLSLCHT